MTQLIYRREFPTKIGMYWIRSNESGIEEIVRVDPYAACPCSKLGTPCPSLRSSTDFYWYAGPLEPPSFLDYKYAEQHFYLRNDRHPVGTIAVGMFSTGQIILAGSMCSPQDQFSREVGRRLAYDRLRDDRGDHRMVCGDVFGGVLMRGLGFLKDLGIKQWLILLQLVGVHSFTEDDCRRAAQRKNGVLEHLYQIVSAG